MIRAAIAGLAATVFAVTAAPPAEATPMSYLQALNNAGVVVYDTQAAVRYGYGICADLDTTTGDIEAARIYANTTWTDVPNLVVAVVLVLAAVDNLCPWHDHRGGYLA